MVVKIVHDELVKLLGAEDCGLNFKAVPPVCILMVGLQGSGKTTTSGKIAKRLKDKSRKKVLLASLDIYRPAAQEQLAQLATQIGVVSPSGSAGTAGTAGNANRRRISADSQRRKTGGDCQKGIERGQKRRL